MIRLLDPHEVGCVTLLSGEWGWIIRDLIPHVPVLAGAVIDHAAVKAGDVWVDCTLGFGGHTERLLQAGARVLGIDQDAFARAHATERLAGYADRFTPIAGNFRDLPTLLSEHAPVDGILADIGVSSWQLDSAERGFSFQTKGPVDMRMNPTTGQTAEMLIRATPIGELAGILRGYGEEPFAGPIARALCAWADADGPFNTQTLAAAVVAALPKKVARKRKKHPATKTFQALRIAVNDELGALDALLDAVPECLRPGGRVLIIAFHSLEDRRVKRTFRTWAGLNRPAAPRRGLPRPPGPPATFELLSRKPVSASVEELAANPRARSARLRGARKLGGAA